MLERRFPNCCQMLVSLKERAFAVFFIFVFSVLSAASGGEDQGAQVYVSQGASVTGIENIHVQKVANTEGIHLSGGAMIIEVAADAKATVTVSKPKAAPKAVPAIAKPNPEKKYREVAKKIKASAQKTSYTNPLSNSRFTQADAKVSSAVLTSFAQVHAIIAESLPRISTSYFYACQFFGHRKSQEFPHLLHAFSVRPPPFLG